MEIAEKLWEIEQIKRLKARYFRLQDQDRWEEWSMLFSEDCENPDPRDPQTTLHGREAIAERTAELAGDWQRAHRGTMPDIELIDETSATGVWALHCANSRLIDGGAAHHHIFGYYTETYRKDADGQWRIKRIQYDNDLMIATSGPVRPYRQDEADN